MSRRDKGHHTAVADRHSAAPAGQPRGPGLGGGGDGRGRRQSARSRSGLNGIGTVGRADPPHRRAQDVVELLAGPRGDLGAGAEVLDGLVDDQQPAGALGGGEDRLHVERDERAQVDDLERAPRTASAAFRHSRSIWPQVTTVTSSPARATRALPIGSGSSPACPSSRRGGGSRRTTTGLGSSTAATSRSWASVTVGGHDDPQARDVGEHRLEALRVLGAGAAARAGLGAEDDRALQRAAGHVGQLRRLVEDRVQADADEVHEHDLDDRPQAPSSPRRPPRREARLADRRVDTRSAPKRSCEAPASTVKIPPPAPTSIADQRRRARRASIASASAGVDGRPCSATRLIVHGHARRPRSTALRQARRRVGRPDRGLDAPAPPARSCGGAAASVSSPAPSTSASRRVERVAVRQSRASSSRLVGLGVALVVAVPAVGLGLDQDGAVARAARGGRPRRSPANTRLTSLPSTRSAVDAVVAARARPPTARASSCGCR